MADSRALGQAGGRRTAAWASAVLGIVAIPLVFVSPLSFVLVLALVAFGGLVALTVFTDPDAGRRNKLLAGIGSLGGVVVVALLLLPLVLQD